MKWLSHLLPVAALAFFLAVTISFADSGPEVYVSQFENVLGTSFELKVLAEEERHAALAEHEALAEIDRLSAILSSYDPVSEFSRWMQTRDRAVPVSPELFEVFLLSDQYRSLTQGALDPAVGVMADAWKKAELSQSMPTSLELNEAVIKARQTHWLLDRRQQTAVHLDNTPLLLNSFVKSYIIQKAAQKVMTLEGISGLVLNIGGDIAVMGQMRERVAVSDPRDFADNQAPLSTVMIDGRTIATSGNYKRGYRINRQWFSHILDPRTAQPAGHVSSASVVSADATLAGALATAFNVLKPDESAKLAGQFPGLEYQILGADGKMFESEGWKRMELPAEVKTRMLNSDDRKPGQKSWDTNFELAVNLELARFEGRSRRPFVAIWIEDSQKNTVRTLALWFNKPRWLPDLKEWYRRNNAQYQEGPKDVFSISSATRPAGKYTISWDGKNDKGNHVAPGIYTVYIEAAREHGTYQLIKQEIECKGKTQQVSMPGNAEINSASLEYRKIRSKP